MLLTISNTGIFVAQSIILWSAGIKLFLHLHVELGTSPAVANLAVFVTGVIATAMFGEAYYRGVDLPSQWFASLAYVWLMH